MQMRTRSAAVSSLQLRSSDVAPAPADPDSHAYDAVGNPEAEQTLATGSVTEHVLLGPDVLKDLVHARLVDAEKESSSSDEESPVRASEPQRGGRGRVQTFGVPDPREDARVQIDSLPERKRKELLVNFRAEVKRRRQRGRRRMLSEERSLFQGTVKPRPIAHLQELPVTAILCEGMMFSSMDAAVIHIKELCEATQNVPRWIRNDATGAVATTAKMKESSQANTAQPQIYSPDPDGAAEPEDDDRDEDIENELVADREGDDDNEGEILPVAGLSRLDITDRDLFVKVKMDTKDGKKVFIVSNIQYPALGHASTKGRSRCAYQSSDLAPLLASNPGLPSMNLKCVRGIIQPYLNAVPTDNFISRLRLAALHLVYGKPQENVQLVQSLKEKMELAGSVFDYSTISGSEMAEVVLAVAKSEHETLRRTLKARGLAKSDMTSAQSLALRTWTNRGSSQSPLNDFITKNSSLMSSMASGDCKYVTEFYFAPRESMRQATRLLRVLSSDAAFCKSVANQFQLFSLVGLSSNGNVIPLAFCWLSLSESAVSWGKVYEFVRKCYPTLDWRLFTLLLDGDKGMEAARAKVLPELHPFRCSKHRFENLLKRATPEAAKLYKRAVSIPSVDELNLFLNNRVSALPEVHREAVLSLPSSHQFMAAHIGDTGLPLYGRHTSQLVESENSAMAALNFRNIDPVAAVVEIGQYVTKKFNAFHLEAYSVFDSVPDAVNSALLTPWAQLKLESDIVKVHGGIGFSVLHQVSASGTTANSGGVVNVNDGGDSFIVRLQKPTLLDQSRFGTCSCNLPLRDMWPCRHMLGAAVAAGVPHRFVIPRCYWACEWLDQYTTSDSTQFSAHSPTLTDLIK